MFISDCLAYDTIEGNVRIDDGVLYIGMKNPLNDIHVCITLNPVQAKDFGEFIAAAAMKVLVPEDKGNMFGGIEMELENVQEKQEDKTDVQGSAIMSVDLVKPVSSVSEEVGDIA